MTKQQVELRAWMEPGISGAADGHTAGEWWTDGLTGDQVDELCEEIDKLMKKFHKKHGCEEIDKLMKKFHKKHGLDYDEEP